MIKLNAHIGYQFTELPFIERFSAASNAGFRAVEFPSPYEYDAMQLAALLDEYQLEMVQFAAPSGSTKGTTGICSSKQTFLSEVNVAVQYAKVLNCKMVHLMSGASTKDLAVISDSGTYRRNLKYGAEALADQGIVPVIEIISSQEVPGYLMSDFDLAQQMLESISELGMILDTYHTQVLGEDCLLKVDQLLPWIKHIQVADFPGRNEPGTGRIDFPALLHVLESRAYTGWIGCEYRPQSCTLDGLEGLFSVMRLVNPEINRS